MFVWIDDTDFINFPVEKSLIPYPGQTIRVYNDLVDTGIINCDTTNDGNQLPNNTVNDFTKPYWDLGNWHFNYLRDVRKSNSDPESRLYGNYFTIAFDFGHQNTLIEFENLDVTITEDKNL